MYVSCKHARRWKFDSCLQGRLAKEATQVKSSFKTPLASLVAAVALRKSVAEALTIIIIIIAHILQPSVVLKHALSNLQFRSTCC